MQSLRDILLKTAAYLGKQGVDRPRFEAEQILAKVLQLKRMELYLRFDQPLAPAELDALRPLVARRGRREPLAWVLGDEGFGEHEFAVHKGVLCPRQDTWALVEAALALLPVDEDLFVADIGTGTGIVGLSIAAARPRVKLYAIDLSAEALANTKENARRLGLEARVALLHGSLLDPVPAARPIDLVVSNPPYIRRGDLAGLDPEVRDWEPILALDGGPDGLDVYRALIPQAAKRVRRGLALEIGHDQAADVTVLMSQAGFVDVTLRKDMAGRDRALAGRQGG